MRILYLHDFPGILGGASRYMQQLSHKMWDRGHESAFFSLGPPPASLRGRSFVYHYRRSPWAAVRRFQFHLRHAPLGKLLSETLADFQPDVVHVHNWGVFRSTVFPRLARHAVPCVMTVHDFTLLDPNPWGLDRSGPFGSMKERADERSLVRARQAVFNAVGLFLCPSDTLRHEIPFPEGKARLLRMPVEVAAASDPPGPPLRLFFAGTLFRSKGADLLLEALARIPDARLEIAGEGEEEAALRHQAAHLGLEPRVRFLGLCDRERMDAAYRRAHLVVVPSRVPENSPLVVLEAGSRGRPAVASQAGGVPEIVAPPARGWTFPSGDLDALARVLKDVQSDLAEVERRGARMASWVRENCDAQAHWAAVEAAYSEIQQ